MTFKLLSRPGILDEDLPKHHLLCTCRRCQPSVEHYVRKLKKA